VVMLRDGFPVNVLKLPSTRMGRAIIGVVDGESPHAVKTDSDVAEHRQLLRSIGYKL